MTEQVRVGIIGTSGYADLLHLPSLKSHPRAQLAAICGRNRARAQEMADKYDIPHVYTDYREMIAQGGLDALAIVTPDDMHYPMTIAALDAGLHVLCEKPMALNAGQAREIVADRFQEQHILLHGEGGTLQVDDALMGVEAGAVIRGARHDGNRFETLPVPDDLWGDVDRADYFSSLFPALFLKQSIGDRLFINAILESRQASPSFADGLKAQEVIDAAIESHQSGTWVSLRSSPTGD